MVVTKMWPNIIAHRIKMSEQSEIIIYQTENGQTKIQTRLEDETVWLSQAQMVELFGKSRSTITEHILNVFNEGELEENLVCRYFRHTTQHGSIEGKTQKKMLNITT
jgi:hypothetical protein